ncbi:MAG: hypothetical protein A3F92_07740 [Candidatus Rokubacteria bacterium RIFCSPLOWO2_12_FULL_71_22]|nr:MAG: hypothetical protein A3F92_07740 [Candidatus Rokubacteria bacterium RIFCSPLOWO2_12_FULL_71_22]
MERIDPVTLRLIATHCDGEGDALTALRHVIAHLRDGYATFQGGMSRARRRELIRGVFACHRESRAHRSRAMAS